MKKILVLTLIAMLSACSTTQKQPAAIQAAKMPTPEEVQARMKEAAAVTANHDVLKLLVGNWKTESKFWTDPNKEPETSKGTVKVTSVLGGRHIRQEYKGTTMGQKFEGLGYIGYDNTYKKYISTWKDNMSTSVNMSTGSFDKATNTFTFTGKMFCPVMKQQLRVRETLQIKDKKTYVFTMYIAYADTPETKGFEITHTKK